MGFSGLGHECSRFLQYSNRHAHQEYLSAKNEDIFQTGHEAEEKMIKRLALIGIKVWGREEKMTGFSGHWRGRIDGKCLGVIEAPDKIHLLEMKSHKHTNFNKVKKHGVKEAFPKHYAQCQIYMYEIRDEGEVVHVCLYVAYCKSTHEFYTERIAYDQDAADELLSKQMNVLLTPYLLSRASDDEDFWMCRFCAAKTICFNREPIRKHCRTCEKGDQCNEGKWECSLRDPVVTLRFEQQMEGCKYWIVDEMFQTSMIPL